MFSVLRREERHPKIPHLGKLGSPGQVTVIPAGKSALTSLCPHREIYVLHSIISLQGTFCRSTDGASYIRHLGLFVILSRVSDIRLNALLSAPIILVLIKYSKK